jgi:crotonobetainyl-CoA:carnitine CoA-transferase CaiB-like acyl-CoA transferase
MEPLKGIRIVELTTNVAAPMGIGMLGDQGADVIRIESVDGLDPSRAIGASRGGVTTYDMSINRNKRSIALDLKDPNVRPLLEDLIRSADVFVQNARPGVMKRIGCDYETFHDLNKDLIYMSLSGFGPDGPAAERRVYDFVIQCVSGIVHSQSTKGNPGFVKTIVSDKVSALVTAQAISSALFARERGLVGGHLVELTMLEANLQFLWPDVFWNNSFVGEGVELKPLIAEFLSTVPTKDGTAAVITVGDDEYKSACEVLQYPEGLTDPRFKTVADRFANGPALMAEFQKRTALFLTDDLIAQMEEAHVPCARINDYDEVFTDPRVTHRESIIEYDHPLGGRVRQPRPAAIFDGEPSGVRLPSPSQGEHTDEIFAALGYGAEQLTELRKAGALK